MGTEIKLSDREAMLYGALREARKASTKEAISVDDLLEHLGDHGDTCASRSTVGNALKSLGAKIAERGEYIKRTSKVGRGHIGEYRLMNHS